MGGLPDRFGEGAIMKRRFFTMRDEPCQVNNARGRKFLFLDMMNALEYPEEYGLSKRRSKGAKCYQVEITIKRVKMPATRKARK